MTLSTTTTMALSAYLMSADLVNSTSAHARASLTKEETLTRSFASCSSWEHALAGVQIVASRTAISEGVPFFIGADRHDDDLTVQINEYRNVFDCWDGEDAAKPTTAAILDAVRFVRSLGPLSIGLESTLHVDGSIILELDIDAGSLRFKGDKKIIYAFERGTHGIVAFNGFIIPNEIIVQIGG